MVPGKQRFTRNKIANCKEKLSSMNKQLLLIQTVEVKAIHDVKERKRFPRLNVEAQGLYT